MNKAFVREPDSVADRCPRCGSAGHPVTATTLDAQLKPASRSLLGESAAFCASETCLVVYFDAFERQATVDDVSRPPYPKDPAAPICGCFGFTEAEIDEDIREGGATRTRAAIERAQSDAARCAQMAASGQSCVANIQRYFMKHRGGVSR
jgi:hypothetical protein